VDELFLSPRALRKAVYKNGDISQMCWHTPAIAATPEAEIRSESSRTEKQRYQDPIPKTKYGE
jgi:hypothetical protein